MPKPAQGYSALFGEYVFNVQNRNVFLSTTPYAVGPDKETQKVKILLKP
jgi:hypothetical protein